MNYKRMINFILGIPKTILVNVKYFGLKDGFKFPIVLSRNVKLKKVNGSIIINKPMKFGMIKIGFGEVGIFDEKFSRSIWQVEGRIEFNGTCDIGQGTKISVGKDGVLRIGNNLVISAETSIICRKNIDIGNDCLISWDNLIMDSDFHKVINNKGQRINQDESITIGNNVWICTRTTILKGSFIPGGSVVGAGSVVSKYFDENNTIITGFPAKVVKDQVEWST